MIWHYICSTYNKKTKSEGVNEITKKMLNGEQVEENSSPNMNIRLKKKFAFDFDSNHMLNLNILLNKEYFFSSKKI